MVERTLAMMRSSAKKAQWSPDNTPRVVVVYIYNRGVS